MKKVKRMLSILLIAYVIVLIVNLTVNYQYYRSGHDWKFSVIFSLSVTTLGCLGYLVLYELFFKRYINWRHNPNLNLLFSVLISGVYGFLLMIAVMKCMVCCLGFPEQPTYDYINNSIYSALFSMLIALIVLGNEFLKQWKKSTEDNERMKAEMIRTQFEALKNQVNPHFLFNSLNTLTAIIPQQPELAVNFVEQLAKVFRYSLQHTDDNIITIAEELKIVNAYIFLNQARFEGKLQVDITVEPSVHNNHIVTHSLLMLVENAIKHNEISNYNPLHLYISNENGWLIVKNSLQPKKIAETSTGIGLQNIKSRYSLITDRQVVIEAEREYFFVKIPILD